jgi:hypothetical protein
VGRRVTAAAPCGAARDGPYVGSVSAVSAWWVIRNTVDGVGAVQHAPVKKCPN